MPRRSLWLLWSWAGLCTAMAAAAFYVAFGTPPVDGSDAWPYLAVFALVLGDAVISALASTIIVSVVGVVLVRRYRREHAAT